MAQPNLDDVEQRDQYDLSSGRRADQAQLQLAAQALEHVPTGVIIAEPETQHVIYSNAAMSELTGYTQDQLQGRQGLFFLPNDPTGDSLPGFKQAIRQGQRWHGVTWGRRANQGWEARVDVQSIWSPDGTSQLLAMFGPAPGAETPELRDDLTGLPNKESFLNTITKRIDQNPEQGLVLIQISVRDMARINGDYGREVGDRVLVELAGRLRQSFPMSVLVARNEGDNFMVLTRAIRRDAVDRVAHRLLQQIEACIDEPIIVDHNALHIPIAMGTAFYPGDAGNSRSLLTQAQTALGRDQQQKNGTHVWAEDHPGIIRERLSTAANLKQTLNTGDGIQPWYQPCIDLARGTVSGAEALARWHDEDRGMISPGEFLPLSDALGMTHQLNWTILDLILRDLARWRATAAEPVPIAINLSSGQLTDPGLPQQILAALDHYDLPNSLLHIEITENSVIADMNAARKVLEEIKAARIEISLDDFGTGYSSLSILRDLPLNRIKLDKTFIDRMDRNSRAIKVARLAIDFAHELNMRVIAEGVESQDQADILRALGCDYAQGFLFARPMAHSDFESQWLRKGR